MADDKQKQEGTGSRTQIIVAVIGVVGVLGAAILANLDKVPLSSSTFPNGSYKKTCIPRSVSVKGDFLTATCADGKGGWKESSLNFKRCEYGVENNWGTLECKK